MNNKILFLVLAALVAIYAISKIFGGRTERTFKSELVAIDTATVTAISLYPKAEQQQEIRLQKSGSSWTVTKGDMTTAADHNAVNALIGSMRNIRAKRVAAKSEEKWTEYETDENGGSRVKVFAGDKLLADFVVGRFSFDQMTRSGTSFVRLAEGPEVYAVDGFLSLSFNQPFGAYRIKKILDIQNGNITRIALSNDGQQLLLAKNQDGQWMANESVMLDSARVAQYVNGLKAISGTEFVEGFDPAGNQVSQRLELSGDNMSPATVSAYHTPGADKPFVIKSSANEAYFSSDSSGVWSRLFKSLPELLPESN